MKIVPFLFIIICWSCNSTTNPNPEITTESQVVSVSEPVKPLQLKNFDRTKIKEQLNQKIANGEPLIIHVFVPLCDNDHQGIVPVPKTLGDGFNPRSNLYWGALYGFKTHFKKHKNWTLKMEIDNPKEGVLERVVFERTYENGAKVWLIGDAYRGDKMKLCVEDYLNAVAGKNEEQIMLDNKLVENLGIATDLVVFNGHNGLMDEVVSPVINPKETYKDAVAIACISGDYFNDYLNYAHGYPLVMTTNLLAPEAYVLSNIFDAWATQQAEKEIMMAAARAYNQYQKCGIKGARRLFSTGF